MVDWIPTDPNDLSLEFMIQEIYSAHRASAIVSNTFDEFEGETLKALSSIYTSLSLYTVGLLSSFLNQGPQHQLASLGFNLWKEETEWLETKDSGSVLYVNFGSSTVMSSEQLFEFAWGLAERKKPFLWIIRPNLVNDCSPILSSEFVNEIKDRGLIASWCSREKVLNHCSIGGFLTHCGCNSMTESVCAGFPMLCWPFFGDQQINCRYACCKRDIGIEIDTNVKRDDVKKLVIELMVGEKGKKMKQKIMEWKKLEEVANRPGGSSNVNLDKVINDVMLKQN